MKLAQRTKRFLALLLAFAMMMTSLVYADTEGDAETPADEPAGIEYVRVAGDSRYDTAIQSADALKGVLEVEKFENIIVASGTSFPDALAGSYLSAAKGNAPILLVANSAKVIDQVSKYVIDNLAENGTVYLLGGTAAVPADFREVLTDSDIKTKRLKGNDRFETNLAILKEAGIEDGSDLIVATGSNFADSLSASASGAPLLLVGRALTDAQKEFLASVKLGDIHIVGGEGVVLPAVAEELKEYAENVERIAGANRFETSTAIAAKFEKPEAMVLAYAQNFPDGLSAGPLAHALGAPLILTQNAQVAIDTAIAWRATQNIRGGFVIGGTALISDETADTIFNTAEYDRTSYYVLAGKEVGWNVTVGYTDETEDDALVCLAPGKKVGKHEVAVENCQWITLSGDNALDENNDFTFEIPVGVKKAKVSYLITAWTDENKLATYADPDGGSKDLSQKEVQDYDESGDPVGDPYLVDADEPYVVKVNGEDALTADSNKYGENAYDESGKGTYTANLHFSKDFWNDWCAIVVVVEETVSGVAPEPTPTPEDVVHEIHGGTVFLAGANEDWSGIQSEGYAYHFGETVRVSLDNASISNPYYLVPAIVFDNEIDDASMLEEMFDVDVKVYADGEEVPVTIPEGQPTIWAEDTAFNGVSQTGNCARLYGGINVWGTSYIDPTALNGAETVVYEITINKIDGKAYILGADENWATVQSEPVEFTVGKPFEITMNGPISNPYWVAPSLIFNQNFVDPSVLNELYRVNVELTVDGNPVDITEPSARIWAEGNEIVVPGEVDEEGQPVKIKYDGNSARLYGGYNEWGTAYVPKDTFNNADVITYSITIERVEGVAYLLGADSNWSPVQSDPVEFKIDGSKYEVSVEGSVNNPYWIAPTLIFNNEFDDPETLNERLDVSVYLVVDGIAKEFDLPDEFNCIWAEDSEIIVPGEFDEEGNPVKIKYSGNAARLYGGYNEWGTAYVPKDTFNNAESIRYIFTLSWDVTSGIKVPEVAPVEPEEDDDIEWVGTSTFLQGEGNGYQDVTTTSSNGITLTMEQWRIAVTFSDDALTAISEMEAPLLIVERDGNAEIWGFGIEDANWTYIEGGNDSSPTTATVLTTAFNSSISYYIDVRDWETTDLKVSVVDSPEA